ncbi:MAG: polysaccharide pyruvyl transferase family protein [Hyphomicrobiales bacterium]
MTETRRLLVLGAFGGVNIGDEVILRAVLGLARTAGYAGRISVYGTGGDPEALPALAREYAGAGVDFLSRWQLPAMLRAAFGRDVFIGGGQVIDGAFGIRLPLVQLLAALAARLSGGRVVVGGVGVGDVGGPIVRAIYRLLFALSADIVLRDRDSAERLGFSAAARARGRVAADAAFRLAADREGEGEAGRDAIILALRNAPHIGAVDFETLRRLAARIADILPDDMRLLVAIHDSRPQFDGELAGNLMAALPVDAGELVSFASTQECLDAYDRAAAVVSARMHPLIIGACRGAAVVPLAGTRKNRALAERLGLPLREMASLLEMPDAALADALGLGASDRRPDATAIAGLAGLAATLFDGFAGK